MTRRRSIAVALCAAWGAMSLAAGSAAASPYSFQRLATVNATESQAVAMAREANGSLALVYQTFAGPPNGLATTVISAAGHPGPAVTAVSGWDPGQPGLLALPGGTLEAVFAGASPSKLTGVWGITSSDGGATWSAPLGVLGGGPTESLAWASDITAGMSGTTPVLTLPQAGTVVIQRGLGPGSPSFPLTNTADGATTHADLATDASTGEVVAAWPSIAGNLTDYLQGAVPTLGALQAIPGQYHNAVVLAGRDTGPGVFAAYSTNGTNVRLLRYGGGSVAVGSRPRTTAKRLGVATGPDGRIWVMWGDDAGGGIAVTRSNKAVTRFEPIQHLDPKAFGLARIFGDGRLGPLDLLVSEVPNVKGSVTPGLFYARVHPELSAAQSVTNVKSKKGKVLGFKVKVTVTDAGDAVQGAHVSIKGKSAVTDSKGRASVSLPASAAGTATLAVTAPTYRALSVKLTL